MKPVIRRSGPGPLLGRSGYAGLLAAMLEALGADDAKAPELLIADDRESARLNGRHLGLAGPTNILSFPGGEEGGPGSLVLSAPALRRECLLYGQDGEEHLVRLLAHGLVHLLGHDHGALMDALCDEAFAAGYAFLQRHFARCPKEV